MKISQNFKTTDTVLNLSTASLSILSNLIEPISSDVSGDVMGCAIACSALDKDGDPSCGAFTTGHHQNCKFMPGPIGLETVDARQAVFCAFLNRSWQIVSCAETNYLRCCYAGYFFVHFCEGQLRHWVLKEKMVSFLGTKCVRSVFNSRKAGQVTLLEGRGWHLTTQISKPPL